MMKLLALISVLSIGSLGCNTTQPDNREAIFKLKSKCQELETKMVDKANVESDAAYADYVWSVTYSPRLNTCLVARDEVVTEGQGINRHLVNQNLRIEDAFSKHVFWERKSTDLILDWDKLLNKEVEALN